MPLRATRLPGWVDPERLFVGLAAAEANVFWLDAGPDATDGWSIVGVGAAADFAEVGTVRIGGARDDAWPAGPFRGGWVGWIDYEHGAAAAGAPAADSIAAARWLRVDRFTAFDHATSTAWAVSPDDGPADAGRWSAQPAVEPVATPTDAGEARARVTAAEHARRVAACRERIRVGDAYQLCLTTTFAVPGAHDAVAVHRRLRASARSHHGGFVRVGDTTLVSASPEQFLTVQGRTVRTKPIKGTRPRSADPGEDARLAADLVASEKERAENVMIVDLMRNDLSRICEPGSVRVESLCAVESYPTVHQLVSTVAGTPRDGATVGDLLAAAFPAGSMTGAPKLSAMTILHELEDGTRGIYSGCFGWVGDDGDLDLAMVIRSVVLTPEGATVGSGGGITWGSVPADEVAEVGVKAAAPLAALGARRPAGW